jgi:hypothetical protein
MILPLKLRPASLNSSSPSLPFSAIEFTTKRPYLSDYELIFRPKYLAKQCKEIIFLSVTLQGIELMNEYTQHMEKQIKAQADGRTLPDFDFAKASPGFVSKTKTRLVRNIFIFVTRKCYEMICVATLPLKLVDRLTKDVQKSLLRKLTKFSQMEAAQRIFFTCFHSSILRALSLLTVDCGYAIYEHFYGDHTTKTNGSQPKKQKRSKGTTAAVISSSSPSAVTCLSVMIWTGKRALFHSLSILLFSYGYSVGTMVHTKLTPTWFATIFEALGGAILTPLLS